MNQRLAAARRLAWESSAHGDWQPAMEPSAFDLSPDKHSMNMSAALEDRQGLKLTSVSESRFPNDGRLSMLAEPWRPGATSTGRTWKETAEGSCLALSSSLL